MMKALFTMTFKRPLHKFVLATLLCGSSSLLRADFTYQDTTQMTGGSLFTMLKALGPLARGARDPIVSTHIIKGNRMATITKDRATVIDLDKENITTIDTAKKTYSVVTFAEMKQQMEEAASRAQSRSKDNTRDNTKKDDVQAQFKVTAKATGQTKTVQGLNAKEMQINMAMEGTDKTTGQTGAMNITTDAWYAPVPGYDEVKEFHKRMAVKLGYIFGSGMQQIAQMSSAQGGQNVSMNMEDLAREMSKIDGVPVESTVVMGGSGTPAAGSSTPAPTAPPQKERESVGAAAAGAAIGRIPGLGGFGRKRKDDSQEAPPAAQSGAGNGEAAAAGSLMEMTTTLTSFSPGAVDASKFEVPAGFKQVEGGGRRGR